MNKFPPGSKTKDFCETIKKYVGKYVVIKVSSGNLYEGWFDECIEHPDDSDDIILRISVSDGVMMISRFWVTFIFEFVYGYADECESRPRKFLKEVSSEVV